MTEKLFLPDSYDYWYQRGCDQLNAKEYVESVTSFDQALQYKTDDHDALYSKGNAYYNLEQYEDAEACYSQSLVSKPNSQNALEGRGLALNQLQHYEEAVVSLDQALKIDPNLFKARWAKGNALKAMERRKEAISEYEKALEIHPDSIELWKLQGKLFSELKLYSKALTSYERALELTRKKGERRAEAEMLNEMVFMYVFNGKSQDAFSALEKSTSIIRELNLPPDDPLRNLSQVGPMPFSPNQIPYQSLMNLWGRLSGFGMKGKPQMFLVFAAGFLLAIPALLVFIPLMFVRGIFRRFSTRR